MTGLIIILFFLLLIKASLATIYLSNQQQDLYNQILLENDTFKAEVFAKIAQMNFRLDKIDNKINQKNIV